MAQTLKQLDYTVLQQCMHCGMCLPTCPTYDATKREKHSPRGRIALMRAVADDELPITKSFGQELSFCLGCLACQTACPAGVNYAELFETARADIEKSGVMASPSRSFWRTLTLRFLFLQPRALRAVGVMLRWQQRLGLDVWARKNGLMKLLPADLERLEPQTPRISPKFSHQLIKEIELPAEQKYRVAMLTGCVQDLAFSQVNRDTVDVLLANGCQVDTPAVQSCCGSLHGHNGEPELAKILARRMLDQFDLANYDAIITNAGGCGSHLRHYGPLLAEDPEYAQRAHAWDAKVNDIHEWLAKIGCRKPQCAANPQVVSYHESCHLTHGQKVVKQPREILRLIPGLILMELPESNWCCGSAGVYSITQPEQSGQLLKRKVDHIIATNATILATSNPGCHLQIVLGLKQAGREVLVTSPVSLLAEAYRKEG